jgi:hypothetical protein
MSEEKIFSGVDALIDRMELYPEEFFENGAERSRWTFMYKDYFRDALTESEKGRMHEAVRKMRRLEFDATVLKELMKDEIKESEEMEQGRKLGGFTGTATTTSNPAQSGWWNKVPVKKEGGRV